jgi:hypothetical protein
MNKCKEWKKENILKFATWNVQDIAHKEELDDILAKKRNFSSCDIRKKEEAACNQRD